jgi:membrane fusion protein, multidrug efflux system
MPTFKPHTLIAAVGIAAAAALGYWYMGKPSAPPEGGAGAPATKGVGVEVAKVQAVKIQDEAQAVGTMRSRQGVMLRPEVAGKVASIGFTEGSRVRKGQVLIQLDDVLQQAESKQAQAQVSVAAANHKRNQELVAKGFIAQRVLDESSAALQVAEAQLALAKARLNRMKIVAPFDGTVGIRSINVGDFVKDGADLVSIEDLSTMQVDFRLPERYQNSLKIGQALNVELDAMPGRLFKGQVQAVDPLIDTNGRSIGVRASLPNNAGVALNPSAVALPANAQPLRPGMFARVTVVFGAKDQALVVPEEAIVPLGGRQFVIKVVAPSSVAGTATASLSPEVKLVSQRQEVKLGIRRPGRVEIVQGLSMEDTVVVAGQQRLQKDGTPVRVIDMSAAANTATASKPAASASVPASAASTAASAAK